MLEALDRLQERLRIPSSIVKELRRKLTQMLTDHARATRLHSSSPSPPFPAHHTMEKLGDAIAESDAWDDASPEEVKGMVHWAIAGASLAGCFQMNRARLTDLRLLAL